MDTLQKILAALRMAESRSNYTEHAPKENSSASGAYQITDRTWAGYGGYPRAYLAPPAVQDEKASIDMRDLLNRFNGNIRYAVAAWFVGPTTAARYGPDSSYTPGNANNPSIAEYVRRFERYFGKEDTTTTTQPLTITRTITQKLSDVPVIKSGALSTLPEVKADPGLRRGFILLVGTILIASALFSLRT